MNLFLPFLISSAMACGAIVLSCFTLLHARSVSRIGIRAASDQKQAESLLQAIAARLNDLAGEMDRLKHQPPPVAAGLPRPGFNLSKRTQALRMHRRGDTPDQIAAALEIPRQEVDLLLKVQRMAIDHF